MDTKRIFKKAVNLLTLSSFLLWNLSVAAPEGGSVAQGSATISQSGAQTTINQTSQNAVINWNSFNTASHEAVQFNQPNASSVALNRITNGLPTQFAGSLNANGQVWILNPAGVLFTNTARVDVAGLVATTHGILDANFMSGNYQFDLVPGSEYSSIINNGLISAKDSGIVALVAPHVANNGLIQANLGKVYLSSGAAYTLDMYGDNLINFGSNAPIQNGSVSNAGTVIANGGKVYMTANYASGVLDNMISMSGTVQAKSVGVNQKGEIVLYGGDYQAKKTAGTTKVSGKLEASSDDNSVGGFIETSGEYVDLTGAEIKAGVGGHWLMDPTDIMVDSTLAAIIVGQLNAGTSVTLDTASGGVDIGDITISAPITQTIYNGNVTLTFIADNKINLGANVSLITGIGINNFQIYNGAVVLASSVSLTGQAIFLSTIDDSTSGTNSLTLNNGGAFYGNVGSIVKLKSLTVANGRANINNNISIHTTGTSSTSLDQDYFDLNVNIYNVNLITDIGNIRVNSFDGALGSQLTVTAASGAGTVELSSSLGDTSITVNGTTYFTDSLIPSFNPYIETGGSIQLNGPVVFYSSSFASGNFVADGGISINGPIYQAATSNPVYIILIAQGSNLTVTGNIGDISATIPVNGVNISTTKPFRLSASTTGTGAVATFSGDAITTTNIQSYLGNTIFTNPSVNLTGSAIGFSGNVDGTPSNAQVVTVTGDLVLVNGNIGATDPLSSLHVTGTSQVGGNITTVNNQTYVGAMTLTASPTLTSAAGSILFGNTINGAFGLTTSVINGQSVTFNGAVGGTTALTSITTSAAGTTYINGGQVRTSSGTQNWNNPVFINAATTLGGAGTTGPININSALDSFNATPRALTLTTTAMTFLNGNLGATNILSGLTVTNAATLNVSSINTTSFQNYNGALTLTGNSNLFTNAAGTLTFGSTIQGGFNLIANASSTGTVNFNNDIGTVGTPLTGLTVTGLANIAANVGPTIFVSGTQTYNNNISLNSIAAITFGSGIGSTTVFNGNVDRTGSSTALTIAGNLVVGNAGAIGQSSVIQSLTVNGTTAGVNVTTAGNQLYSGAYTLTEDDLLVSTSGSITFGSTVDGAFGLTARAMASGQAVVFNGVVGGATPLTSLTLNSGGALGTTNINAASITTSGAQNYTNLLTIAANSVISSNSGGALNFAAINSLTSRSLTITSTGLTTFSGTVGSGGSLSTLVVNGPASFSTAIINANSSMTFNGPVTLAVGTIGLATNPLGSIIFGSTIDGASALTLDASTGTVTLNGVVGGATKLTNLLVISALNINAGVTGISTNNSQTYQRAVTLSPAAITFIGTTIAFQGAVTGLSTAVNIGITPTNITNLLSSVSIPITVQSLLVTGTSFVGGNITTTNGQTYRGVATTLASLTYADSSANGINFNDRLESTAAGTHVLTINESVGSVVFGNSVGSTNLFSSLTVTGAAGIQMSGPVIKTVNNQVLNSPVILNGSPTLTSTSGNITFNSTINGDGVSGRGLTLSAAVGSVAFNGIVGGSVPLASLSATAGSQINVNTSAISTAGPQSYFGVVAIFAPTLITFTGSDILFNQAILNGGSLITSINIVGNLALDAPSANLSTVGAFGFFDALTVSGSTTVNNSSFPAISTKHNQLYSGPVILNSDGGTLGFVGFSSTGGNITFNDTINGASDMVVIVNSPTGTATFNGVVGGVTPLTSLTVNGNLANINTTGITTTGAQTYGTQVVLGSDTVLTSTIDGITFSSTVDSDGTPRSLTLDSFLPVTLTGNIGSLPGGVLSTLHIINQTNINTGIINTTTSQLYDGEVILNSPTVTLTSGVLNNIAGTISFGSTIDGASDLTTTVFGRNIPAQSGNTYFKGSVGSVIALNSLTVNNAVVTQSADGININMNNIPNFEINTIGTQQYNAQVILAGDVLSPDGIQPGGFNSAVGNVVFNALSFISGGRTGGSTQPSPFNFSASAPLGEVVFGYNPVGLLGGELWVNSFHIYGATTTTRLNGINAVITNSTQTYDGPVLIQGYFALGQQQNINAAAVIFNGPVSSPSSGLPGAVQISGINVPSVTLTDVTFNSNADVGVTSLATAPLYYLNIASQNIHFNATFVHTALYQSIFGNLVFGSQPTVIFTNDTNGSTNPIFAYGVKHAGGSIVGASTNLIVNADFYINHFGQPVTLADLNVGSGFMTLIPGGVTVSTAGGAQNYGGQVILANFSLNTPVNLNGATITFDAPVVMYPGLPIDLIVTGDMVANDVMGPSSIPGGLFFAGQNGTLKSLTVNGQSNLNGGLVNTTNDQLYNGPVIASISSVLSSSGGNITFNNTVNGFGDLTMSAVAININTNSIVTTGFQDYTGVVNLIDPNVQLGTSSNVNFNNTVEGSGGLVVNGNLFAYDHMGFNTPLGYLTVNGTAEGVNIIAVGNITMGPFNVVTNDLVQSLTGNVDFTGGPVTLFANLDVIAAEQIFFGAGANGVTGPFALSAQSLNPIYGPTGQGVTGTVNVASFTLGGPGGGHLSQNYPITESFVAGQGVGQAFANTIISPDFSGSGAIYCINNFCALIPVPVNTPVFDIPPIEIFDFPTPITCDGSGCSSLEIMIDNLVPVGVIVCGGISGCGFGFTQAEDTNGAKRILMPGDVVYAGDRIVKEKDTCACIKSLINNKKICLGPKEREATYYR